MISKGPLLVFSRVTTDIPSPDIVSYSTTACGNFTQPLKALFRCGNLLKKENKLLAKFHVFKRITSIELRPMRSLLTLDKSIKFRDEFLNLLTTGRKIHKKKWG